MHWMPLKNITLCLLLSLGFADAQDLQTRIAKIAQHAKGQVSVACDLPGTPLDCSWNAGARSPMQSVFKLPLALTALHHVEQGKIGLDQPIRFLPSDRILPRTVSPLQDQHPHGNVVVPLRELLRLAVTMSDNAAADIVMRTIGGPSVVERYIHSLGIAGFQLRDNEATLHRDVSAQYRNWFEAGSAVQLMRLLQDRSPVNATHTRLLFDWLRETQRGQNRIKGRLPQGTVVMHRPGTSGTDNGLAHATNDIGLIVLPDGRRLAIAVFVTDSRADEATRELVIAKIARATYDAAAATRALPR